MSGPVSVPVYPKAVTVDDFEVRNLYRLFEFFHCNLGKLYLYIPHFTHRKTDMLEQV